MADKVTRAKRGENAEIKQRKTATIVLISNAFNQVYNCPPLLLTVNVISCERIYGGKGYKKDDGINTTQKKKKMK